MGLKQWSIPATEPEGCSAAALGILNERDHRLNHTANHRICRGDGEEIPGELVAPDLPGHGADPALVGKAVFPAFPEVPRGGREEGTAECFDALGAAVSLPS